MAIFGEKIGQKVVNSDFNLWTLNPKGEIKAQKCTQVDNHRKRVEKFNNKKISRVDNKKVLCS